jgi:shikimate dehydrogenase
MKSPFYAIFGDPVAHSLSPRMHNAALRALGIDGCYGRYRLAEGDRLRELFFTLHLQGANITVPHKEAAFAACDRLDPFAQAVGAVNTIVRQGDRLHGYNTDAPGFLKAIAPFDAHRILLLGAGGTARSTAVVLRDAGYDVTILNRTQARLEHFAIQGFATYTHAALLASLTSAHTLPSYDLIVNMTSAGLADRHLPAPRAILDALLPNAHACIDIIYGHETPFLALARSFGKPVADGTEMLLQQGAIALSLFLGTDHAHTTIEDAMRKALLLA